MTALREVQNAQAPVPQPQECAADFCEGQEAALRDYPKLTAEELEEVRAALAE